MACAPCTPVSIAVREVHLRQLLDLGEVRPQTQRDREGGGRGYLVGVG